MNAPELVFRANANRLTPGVNVPVAAPSWALAFAVSASCWSVRPLACGNWPALGCAAAPSSETAGGGPVVGGPETEVVVELAAELSAVVLEDLVLEEDPQPET